MLIWPPATRSLSLKASRCSFSVGCRNSLRVSSRWRMRLIERKSAIKHRHRSRKKLSCTSLLGALSYTARNKNAAGAWCRPPPPSDTLLHAQWCSFRWDAEITVAPLIKARKRRKLTINIAFQSYSFLNKTSCSGVKPRWGKNQRSKRRKTRFLFCLQRRRAFLWKYAS